MAGMFQKGSKRNAREPRSPCVQDQPAAKGSSAVCYGLCPGTPRTQEHDSTPSTLCDLGQATEPLSASVSSYNRERGIATGDRCELCEKLLEASPRNISHNASPGMRLRDISHRHYSSNNYPCAKPSITMLALATREYCVPTLASETLA